MPVIHLTTVIHAPAQRVFDLSRSLNLHQHSMKKHKEEIADGKKNGLLNLNETVTWQARHLGKKRLLTSCITEMEAPDYFCDELVKGDFTALKHQHYYKPIDNGTIMIDMFNFTIPYGRLGEIAGRFYLNRYMKKLLLKRNKMIKEYAEGNQWKNFL